MKHRPFCDMRASMKTNCLLQRPKVGRTIQSTQDLPPDDFAYGKVYHQDYGVKELLSEWRQLNSYTANRRRNKHAHERQDFVATNRAAVRSGCISAHEFRDFKKKHRILVKPEENLAAAEDEYNAVIRRNMVHGIPTPVNSEMKDCLTYKFCRDAVERARQKQTIRHMPKEDELRRKANHGVQPTRASRGHTVKPPEEPSYADTFKMKRFLAIDHYAIDDKW